MKNEFKKSAGISLLAGALLATITMTMHPMGNNIESIAKIGHLLMFSHSVAIICMTFIAFGFWGLSHLLETNNKLSFLSFCICCFGLVAAMIAAAINGLVLPLFASNYLQNAGEINLAKTVLDYGKYINFSMATIFIGAVTVSIAIWSVLIIRWTQLSKWLGYYGLLLVAFGIIGISYKFNCTDLFGFRVFAAGLVSWKIAAGFLMLKKAGKQSSFANKMVD